MTERLHFQFHATESQSWSATMCWDPGSSESPSAGHSPGRGKERAETNVWEDIYLLPLGGWVYTREYTLGNDHKLPEDYILSPAASYS